MIKITSKSDIQGLNVLFEVQIYCVFTAKY